MANKRVSGRGRLRQRGRTSSSNNARQRGYGDPNCRLCRDKQQAASPVMEFLVSVTKAAQKLQQATESGFGTAVEFSHAELIEGRRVLREFLDEMQESLEYVTRFQERICEQATAQSEGPHA